MYVNSFKKQELQFSLYTYIGSSHTISSVKNFSEILQHCRPINEKEVKIDVKAILANSFVINPSFNLQGLDIPTLGMSTCSH